MAEKHLDDKSTLLRKTLYSKIWWKSFFQMLAGVFFMGFSLSLLVLTRFGTDPCSAMNYGVSRQLRRLFGDSVSIFGLSVPITFGNYQLAFNLILLIFILLFYRSKLGPGTLGNMVVVGYTADFFSYIWKSVCHIPESLPLTIRFAILIPALLVFVFSAAVYMQSKQGVAPYDAIPFIISDSVRKRTGKNFFRYIRLSEDLLAALIGLFTGGECGLMTFLMVLLLGPTVQYVGNLFHKQEA